MSINYLVLLLSSAYFSTINCIQGDPSIVVIGAGPSGIAASTKLLKYNFTNVKILEAEDRIGGRIRSVKFGDAYVDLGAEWCHGEEDNIVYNMVNKHNILRHTNLSHKLIYSNGEYISDEIYEALIDFTESIDASQTNPVTEASCKNVSSVGECFEKRFNLTFLQKYKDNQEKLNISLDSVDWLTSYMLTYDSSFSLFDLSRKSEYKRCKGDMRLNWNGHGYKTILDIMMQKYPDSRRQLPIDDKIYLKKEVTNIIWNNTNKILIRCLDNTSFEADHVIFTPSLGVLKDSHDKIFQPKLPNEKIRAIRSFSFGATMKVVLQFPRTWWNEDELFGFVWRSEDKSRIISEFPHGPVKNGKSWLRSSVKFFQAENNPKVLIGFFAGEIVPDLERESDQLIIDGCMYLFKTFLGRKYSVVGPNAIIRSSWYNNPYFRGTYSYESAKGSITGIKYPEKLAYPLKYENGDPSVLFAGEATHPYYFSTVHGAIESGYREAETIINLYNRNGRYSATLYSESGVKAYLGQIV